MLEMEIIQFVSLKKLEKLKRPFYKDLIYLTAMLTLK